MRQETELKKSQMDSHLQHEDEESSLKDEDEKKEE